VKSQGRIIAIASLVLALSGCFQSEMPTAPSTPGADSPSAASNVITSTAAEIVNGYLVTFVGRTVVDGKTTFTYTVAGTGEASNLDRFVIQIPPCATGLKGAKPIGGHLGLDPSTGIFGMKWDLPLGSTETRQYSITFAGDIPLGVVKVGVRHDGTAGVVMLPGPCQGSFLVSGTVFVDTDASGFQDPTFEPGIAGVTVEVVTALGTQSASTDAGGHYQFTLLPTTYTLRIPSSTTAVDFNEQLASWFIATGPVTRNVTIGPNSTGNDFGFKPDASEITADIESGALPTTGKDQAYWARVLFEVKKGRTLDGYDAATILGFLSQIEARYFPDPYHFTDGQELHEAYLILIGRPTALVDQLFQTLFTSQLNDAAGKGLTTQVALQGTLISWGESLIIEFKQETLTFKEPTIAARPVPSIETDIQAALTVFNGLNQRGGGDIPD